MTYLFNYFVGFFIVVNVAQIDKCENYIGYNPLNI
jgi:hypothetical protein